MHSQEHIDELRRKLYKQVHFVNTPSSISPILDEPDVKDQISISFGYRPSGYIHLGNILTMLSAFNIAQYFGIHRTHVNSTNCDLELPNPRFMEEYLTRNNPEILDKQKRLSHYLKYLKSETNPDVSMSQENNANIEDLLQKIQKETNVGLTRHTYSEIQKEEGYRESLKRFCERSEGISEYFIGDRQEKLKKSSGGIYIFPVCPDCKVGNKQGSTYKDGKLNCSCPLCSKKLEFDIEDPQYEIASHFLLDPIRDLSGSAQSDIHVFGGDYNEGPCNFSKLEKIGAILNAVKDESRQTPILFSAPMIYAENGKKMGKSEKNGLKFSQIESVLGEDSIKKLIQFNQFLLNEELRHVDFSVTRKELLSK